MNPKDSPTASERAEGPADERAAFEKWCKSDEGGWWDEALERVGDGYHAKAVNKEWRGWQARAALAAPAGAIQPQKCQICKGVIENCTGDDCDGTGEFQAHLVGAPVTLSDAASEAVRDIVAERRRQVEKEGWTPQHDDEHNDGSMARAAATYALYDLGVPGVAHIEGIDDKLWPWAMWWLKPKDNRSNLVRAGALIIAEVERLDRKAARAWKPCGKCTTPDYCTGVLRGCDIAESLESGIEPISGSPSPAAAPQGGDTGAPS